jgi:hypothetical protein
MTCAREIVHLESTVTGFSPKSGFLVDEKGKVSTMVVETSVSTATYPVCTISRAQLKLRTVAHSGNRPRGGAGPGVGGRDDLGAVGGHNENNYTNIILTYWVIVV